MIPPGLVEISVRGANPPNRLDDAIRRMAATGKTVAEMEMVINRDGSWIPSKKEKKMRMMKIKKEIKMMERKVAVTGILHKKLQSKVLAEVRAFEVFKERRYVEDHKINARKHVASWDLHG